MSEFSGRLSGYHPVRANSILRDITDGRKYSEQHRNWQHQRLLLQKVESLKTMAAAIAHHFNNQLGVVIGNLEMVLEDMRGMRPRPRNLTYAMKAARNEAEFRGYVLIQLSSLPLNAANINKNN